MIKTVIELDLVAFSTISKNLEQSLDVTSVFQINKQIQSFIDTGLEAVNAQRDKTVMTTTGDGAILVFDSAQDAHRFAEAVHAATTEHNRLRELPLTKRVFRIGAATGEIVMEAKPSGGFEIAGTTIARAVRLEAKAPPGGLLVDEPTFNKLSADQQRQYGPKTRVAGKRNEEFDVYGCQWIPEVHKDDTSLKENARNESRQEIAGQPDPDQRRQVLAQFKDLKSHQYAELIFLLEIPIGQRPPDTLTSEERKKGILDWVEENNHMGALLDVLRELNEGGRRPPQVGSSGPDRHTLVSQTCSAQSISRVAISCIDKYAPAQLIGREAETKLLNDAWTKASNAESARPHIFTLVGVVGEGKTSLIAKWAADLAYQDWPGCNAVFGWSFYSQGTREQIATSSDLFLKEALTFFGDPALSDSSQGAFDKGRRLSQLVGKQRALLILDGLEPLQYPPALPMLGGLKDQGLAALLKGLAAFNQGLCVVTTRHSIPDLRAYWQTTAPEITLPPLSNPAGVAMLQSLGVKGTPQECETLVEKVHGHALTLNLLGSYLHDAHAGDIRKHDLVDLNVADNVEQGGHAFRVMNAYVRWLDSGGKNEEENKKGHRDLAMLRLLGFFDRPATADCLAALQKAPVIPRLTEALAGISNEQWNLACSRFEATKLLTVNRDAAGTLLSLDLHPLLREYFALEVRTQDPEAWRAAHQRLYEHLCKTTKDKPQPMVEDLDPLYQAVGYGCQAGMQKDALDKVFRARILRGEENYSSKQLGLIGSNLGAVACFFDSPWNRVSPLLKDEDQAWLLNEAAICLRALGRLTEALEPMHGSCEIDVKRKDYESAAISYSNLSELEIILGELGDAVENVKKSSDYAKRSRHAFPWMVSRTIHADVLHQAGRRQASKAFFREAEGLQADHIQLYSVRGFRYCDLLLSAPERASWQCMTILSSLGKVSSNALKNARASQVEVCRAVTERASQTLHWATETRKASLLTVALDHLTLGRTALYGAILQGTSHNACHLSLQHALDGLRRAGQQQYLPAGLLTRAWLRCLDGARTGLESAQSDLDEAWEIAERGPMRLFQADIHLCRARLFFREAHYPWNKNLDGTPRRPKDDLAAAEELIIDCGYHRRDEELADAKLVIC